MTFQSEYFECVLLAFLAFCADIPIDDSVIIELASTRNLSLEHIEKAYNYFCESSK